MRYISSNRSAVSEFLKKQSAAMREVPNIDPRLDKAFRFSLRSLNLIRAERYAGSTALCLYAAELFAGMGIPTILVDVTGSTYEHRLKHVDKSFLTIFYPQDATAILQLVKEFRGFENFVLILDSARYIRDGWNLGVDIESFCKRARLLCNGCTVINTVTDKYTRDYWWSNVVDVSMVQKKYEMYRPIGHTVKISGSLGEVEHYIEYYSGNLSKAFSYAMEEIENDGVSPNSKFSLGGFTQQGVWEFIKRYEEFCHKGYGSDPSF